MAAGLACMTCGSTEDMPTESSGPTMCTHCNDAAYYEEEEDDDCRSGCPDCGAAHGQACLSWSDEYPEEDDYEEPPRRARCACCRCVMDGDEGWGVACSRQCATRLLNGF